MRGRSVRQSLRPRLAHALAGLLLAFACGPIAAKDVTAPAPQAALAARDRALIETTVAAMPVPADEAPVLYVIGVAGDGTEDVFRNEVHFLETAAAARLGAAARTLTLINHTDSLDTRPRPLATQANLRHALERVAARQRPEDLLLLYLTMHGADDHRLGVYWPPYVDETITPKALRALLDDAGIGPRIVVVSACYAGGFVPALRAPDTLVITAAAADRPSFGCGSESTITFFGRAWLLDGLNRDRDFTAAYRHATRAITARETDLGFTPSRPQIDIGKRMPPRLARWLATLPPAEPARYPHPID